MTQTQSASLEARKSERESLRRKLRIEQRKIEVYYKKYFEASYKHRDLKERFEMLDRLIFEEDPGVKKLPPFVPRKKAAPYPKERPTEVKVRTAEEVMASMDPDFLSKLIAEAMMGSKK